MALVADVTPTAGVKVAVQVLPPSAVATAESVPPCTVKSALLKPLTTSLKVMVTAAVSPALSVDLSNAMVALGARVSTT